MLVCKTSNFWPNDTKILKIRRLWSRLGLKIGVKFNKQKWPLFSTLNGFKVNGFSIFWCHWVRNWRFYIFWNFHAYRSLLARFMGLKPWKSRFFRKIGGLFRALNGSKVDQISIFWARWNQNGEISLSAKFQLSATSVGRLRALQSQKSKNDVLPWYKTESDFHTGKRRSSKIFFSFSGSIYEARKHGGGPLTNFFVWCPLQWP